MKKTIIAAILVISLAGIAQAVTFPDGFPLSRDTQNTKGEILYQGVSAKYFAFTQNLGHGRYAEHMTVVNDDGTVAAHIYRQYAATKNPGCMAIVKVKDLKMVLNCTTERNIDVKTSADGIAWQRSDSLIAEK